jgi:hypothetical protein
LKDVNEDVGVAREKEKGDFGLDVLLLLYLLKL